MGDARSGAITIRFSDVGEGEPAVLCLPGWCASRAAFDEMAEKLGRRRRVLALDWRGHGRSDPAPADFGAAELVDDALAVISASGANEVVPLATAHAGWEAIELRRRLGPARIPKLVLVDWIVTRAPPPFLAGLAALQDPTRFTAARDQLFGMWLQGVDHEAVATFVREDMGSYAGEMWARAGREIAAAYERAGSPLDALAALDPPALTLHLYAQPADAGYLDAQRAFAARHAWFQVEKLEARSHFPTLEVPELVVDRVERFIRS